MNGTLKHPGSHKRYANPLNLRFCRADLEISFSMSLQAIFTLNLLGYTCSELLVIKLKTWKILSSCRMKLYYVRGSQPMCWSTTWWQKRILLFRWRMLWPQPHPLRNPETTDQWTVKDEVLVGKQNIDNMKKAESWNYLFGIPIEHMKTWMTNCGRPCYMQSSHPFRLVSG